MKYVASSILRFLLFNSKVFIISLQILKIGHGRVCTARWKLHIFIWGMIIIDVLLTCTS